MAERTRRHEFVKLSDSDFRLQAPEQDIRGLEVFDRRGDQVGSVEDLCVDEQERKVRFLEVGAGGVTVDQSREKVIGSPAFDPNVVPESPYQRDLYDYYGYPYYPL